MGRFLASENKEWLSHPVLAAYVDSLPEGESTLLDVGIFAQYYNPMSFDTWGVGEITHDDIVHHLKNTTPSGSVPHGQLKKMVFDKTYHISRIAYLVDNGWDDRFPVTLDFRDYYWAIQDGNHRIAASIHMGLDFVEGLVLQR